MPVLIKLDSTFEPCSKHTVTDLWIGRFGEQELKKLSISTSTGFYKLLNLCSLHTLSHVSRGLQSDSVLVVTAVLTNESRPVIYVKPRYDLYTGR